jgi:hypothetical protein
MILVHPDFIYPLGLTLIQWMCVWILHKCLREREILLSAIAGKTGAGLLHNLRDASLQAEVAARSLRAVKLVEAVFQAIIFVVFLLAAAFKAPLSWQALMLGASHALFGFLVTGVMNMYAQNQFLLGEGMVVPARFEWSRMASIVALPLMCVPVVLLLSRHDAPLSLSAILSALDAFFRSFPALPMWRLMDPVRIMLEQQQRYSEMTRAMSAAPLSPLFLLFIFVLRRLIRIALILGLYFFLVSPLLSEEFLQSIRTRSFMDFIRRKLNNILRAGRRFAQWIRAWLSLKGRAAAREKPEARDDARDAARPPRPHVLPWRKRLQMSAVLKAYLRFLQWGESRGVPHRICDAPREYASRIATLFPEASPQLTLMTEILEETLFSTHLLPRDRVGVYFSTIREIRKSGGGPDGKPMDADTGPRTA